MYNLTSNVLWRGNKCKCFSQLFLLEVDASKKDKFSSNQFPKQAEETILLTLSRRFTVFLQELQNARCRSADQIRDCIPRRIHSTGLRRVCWMYNESDDNRSTSVWLCTFTRGSGRSVLFRGVHLILLTSMLQCEIIWVIVVYFHLGWSPGNLSHTKGRNGKHGYF